MTNIKNMIVDTWNSPFRGQATFALFTGAGLAYCCYVMLILVGMWFIPFVALYAVIYLLYLISALEYAHAKGGLDALVRLRVRRDKR